MSILENQFCGKFYIDMMLFWPCLSMLRPKLCWRQGTILLPALEFQGWLVALAAAIHSFNWSTGLECQYLRTNFVGNFRYDSMFFWPCLSMLRPKLCWRQGTILLPALEFQGWTSSWNSKSLVALAATIHSFNWSTGLDCLSPHYLRTNSVGTKCNHHVLAGLLLEQLLDGQCRFTASSWGFFRAADF